MRTHRRHVLTVGHSYVVALNRRLATEMARVSNDRWKVTVVAPPFLRGDLRPILLKIGADEICRVEPVALHGFAPHLIAYGRGLRAVLRDRWDIVHCWEEPWVLAAAQVGRQIPPEARFVAVTAQNLPKRYPAPFNWIERVTMQRADGWICFGHTAEEVLTQRRPYDEKRHRVIPLGVDVDAFAPDRTGGRAVRTRLGWGDGPPVVGYLGRFVPEKGVRFLMEVLDGLSCEWRAVFVGGGPLVRELRKWAARHDGRVNVVTNVAHEDVPAYLNAMDVLCAPSLTTPRWREQFGRMLVEAFACGVPVIGSTSGEIPHVIGSDGLVVREGDVVAWRSALEELLADPVRRRELAARGLEKAHGKYTWKVIAAQHLAFFDEVLDHRASAGARAPMALAR